MKYILITPARNESEFIEHTLRSVVAQTHRPQRWIIVDDGSTDETPQIVERYVKQNPWIELVRRPSRADRSFAAKAQAVNAGLERVRDVQFEVMGNLDADVSFECDYLAFVVSKFGADPKLGVAGTPFTEVGGYDSMRDSFEGQDYVAGPCQLFRYACWKDIGGYVANKAGGVDWVAVMSARMKGWTVRAFPEKRFHHHRSMGTAETSPIGVAFAYGERAYFLGSSPVWHLFRCAYRMLKKPHVTGGLALLSGYCWAAARRMKRLVSPEMMRFHRRDQMKKLKAVFGDLLRLKQIDHFSVGTSRAHPVNDSRIGAPTPQRERSKNTEAKD